jgi:hypothetical protein
VLTLREETEMFAKFRKNRLPWNIKSAPSKATYEALGIPTFNLTWYPNHRSCANNAKRRGKFQNIPPLMVRKPEWRR